jgi:hypothetical protein
MSERIVSDHEPDGLHDALRRRTGSANRGADLSTPSFPAGTRREEVTQSRAEMTRDYFKPENEPYNGVPEEFFKLEFATDDEMVVKKPQLSDECGELSDPVNQPSHYKSYPVEVIDIIRHVLGPEGFRAYCIGNELKYRLRAGDKGDAEQDLAKAMKYREFREEKG